MLRSVLVVLFWRAALADDRCVGGWQTGDGDGGYETYIGIYSSREQCIDAVKSRNDGANGATYGSSYCYAEYGQTTVYYTSSWENCLFASDDQSTGSRDLDGDGVRRMPGRLRINERLELRRLVAQYPGGGHGELLLEPFVARFDPARRETGRRLRLFITEDCTARGGLWSDDSTSAPTR